MSQLKYGSTDVEIRLPSSWEVDWIFPPRLSAIEDPSAIIGNAILNPVGLDDQFKINPNALISISINDNTRPLPNNLFIPPLIKFLENNGAMRNNIRLFIANGTHVPMTPENYNTILPEEIIRNYQIISHDSDDFPNLTFCGITQRGTQVYVNKQYFDSDLKVVTGNIEPHHFMGFSGGVKSAAIGLAGKDTITANHSFLLDPHAKSAEYDLNPMRQDVEEIGELIGIDLAFNVVLSPDKTLGAAFLGAPKSVMQMGIPIAKQLCMIPVTKKYDIVIVSPGGYPKDINLYQAQKAMTNASTICKEGGIIVLLAECRDGVGSHEYYDFMQGVPTFKEAVNKFNEKGFIIGQHKAVLVANIGLKQSIFLVSSIDPAIINSLLIKPFANLNDAIRECNSQTMETKQVAILPFGSTTLPYYEVESENKI